MVRIKLKCYEVSKTRIQSAEEYLKHFLEAEVKNLWPPGWMQSRLVLTHLFTFQSLISQYVQFFSLFLIGLCLEKAELLISILREFYFTL